MSKDNLSQMELISTLVWHTERPLYDAVRRTPKFWLLGYEWRFSLQLFYDQPSQLWRYKITLCKLADKSPLAKKLTVTVNILNTSEDGCCCKITSSDSAEQVVWNRLVTTADSRLGGDMRYGKWTIIFIFKCEQPLQLRLSKNETELALSRSDTDPQLSPERNAKNLPKTILSEDKCVQACSDLPPDLESLSGDISQLLQREIFPDVKLRCGDRTISAHRSILAARSDVFTTTFQNKMEESETGTVDVTDVDSDVLDLLLQYVYSGKIPELSEDTASRLYAACGKYCIHALKKACSDWMVRNLTAENCLGYLMVADASGDEDFKDRVVDFVAENLESVEKDAWSKFNKSCGGLTVRVYEMRLAPALAKQL